MAAIPDAILNEIRTRLPVSAVVGKRVQLKKKGAEWEGLSPFNAEKTPSFTVNDQKQFYHCFSSGKHGDIFTFVMETEGCSFPEAVAMLAGEAGVSIDMNLHGASRPTPADQPRAAATSETPSTDRPKNGSAKAKREIKATYDYTDPNGNLIYQVVRYEPKGFAQRRPSPDGDGAWIWGLDPGDFMRKGPGSDWIKFDKDRYSRWGFTEQKAFSDEVEHGLYRVPELREAVAGGDLVFIPEGEKDVDRLWKMGFPATTNSGGAKHWSRTHAEMFRDADVIVPVDNDKPGRERGEDIAKSLKGIAKRVRVLDLSLHWQGMPEKKDISDWLDQGGTDESLLAIVDKTPEWKPTRAPSRFGRVSWKDLDAPGPEHEYIIDGIFTVGDKSAIGGPSRSGKSFFAIHAGMSMARGTAFFGRKILRRGLVIYQAGEGARGVKKRLRAYRKHFDIPADEDVPFELLQSKIDLYHPDGDTAALIEEIKAIAAEYAPLPLVGIFIDTLAKAADGADENSGKDMSTVMANVDKIEQATGAHVCLVHHMNAGGTKLRGHTSVYANIDQVVLVTRDETTKIRTAVLDKQKDDEDGVTIKFELMSVKVGTREDGKPITSCVCLELGEKDALLKAEEKKGFILNSDTEKNLWTGFASAVSDVGRAPPDDVKAPDNVLVVRYRDWARALSANSGKTMDAARQQVSRYAQRFMRLGLIGTHQPEENGDTWAWWTGKTVRGFDPIHPVEQPAFFGMPQDDADEIGW